MSEQQLNEIADKADMIIANYSFTVTDNGDVEHTLSFEDAINDLTLVSQQNGGKIQ